MRWANWPLYVPSGQTTVNCYHFNQEVSTKKPQASTFSSTTTMEDAGERGRGRVRGRMRATFKLNQNNLSWLSHQPWANIHWEAEQRVQPLAFFPCNFLFQFTVLWAYFCSRRCKHICCTWVALTCLVKNKRKNKQKKMSSYNLNYFSIMAKHTTDESAFH